MKRCDLTKIGDAICYFTQFLFITNPSHSDCYVWYDLSTHLNDNLEQLICDYTWIICSQCKKMNFYRNIVKNKLERRWELNNGVQLPHLLMKYTGARLCINSPRVLRWCFSRLYMSICNMHMVNNYNFKIQSKIVVLSSYII